MTRRIPQQPCDPIDDSQRIIDVTKEGGDSMISKGKYILVLLIGLCFCAIEPSWMLWCIALVVVTIGILGLRDLMVAERELQKTQLKFLRTRSTADSHKLKPARTPSTDSSRRSTNQLRPQDQVGP